jgi:glycosyltransferase involved in cell wall biosynthesis
MIVKDAESTLARCLESVAAEVDEIVIVDTGSTDRTVEIAERFTSGVHHIDWNDNFSEARNFALDQSDGDFHLILDADEYLSSGQGLKASIEALRATHGLFIGKLLRRNAYLHQGAMQFSSSYLSRIIPRSIRYVGAIHEQVDSGDLPAISLPTFCIEHDGYLETDKSKRNIPILLKVLQDDSSNPYLRFQLGREYRIQGKYDLAENEYLKALSTCDSTLSIFPPLVVDIVYNCLYRHNFHLGYHVLETYAKDLQWYSDFHFVRGLFFMRWILSDIEQMKYFSEIEAAYKHCLLLGEQTLVESVEGTGSYLAAQNLAAFYRATGNHSEADRYNSLASMMRRERR